MKRPLEGILERPGFVVALGVTTSVGAAMLAWIAYDYFTIHKTGAACFAAIGAILTGVYASSYFRDSRALRRGSK